MRRAQPKRSINLSTAAFAAELEEDVVDRARVLGSLDVEILSGGAPRDEALSDLERARITLLENNIRRRIESRLPGRVRQLKVRATGTRIVLEGQCSTYYTKQLAQHAALGILEDEQLTNAIEVRVPR